VSTSPNGCGLDTTILVPLNSLPSTPQLNSREKIKSQILERLEEETKLRQKVVPELAAVPNDASHLSRPKLVCIP